MSGQPDHRWIFPEETFPPGWESLGPDASIPGPGWKVLYNRGLRTADDLRRFLRPGEQDLLDPLGLPDLPAALDRLLRAREQRETILVFGDSDADGITATVLFTRALRRWGFDVRAHVPSRLTDGFGLTAALCDFAHRSGAGLIIANDCGTNAHEAASRARDLGIDIIVVDHHVPDRERPPFTALVNPLSGGDGASPFRDLAAVGVAYKILQALASRQDDQRTAPDLLDFAALGTLADQVPLRGENRTLVLLGLERLRRDPRPSLAALADWAGEDLARSPTERLARFLIPRLNACGRMGVPAQALELLLCDDPGRARSLAAEVEQVNRARRHETDRLCEDASIKARREEPRALIVLGDPSWHPGVLGIAASRLSEQTRRPVFLVATGQEPARGSARCRSGTDLLTVLRPARDLLLTCGGHPRAVGFSLPRERFGELRSALLTEGGEPVDPPEEEPVLLEGELDPAACDPALARWMESLAPFGPGNPEPFFLGRGRCSAARVESGRHLRLRLAAGGRVLDCVGFGLAALVEDFPRTEVFCDVAFRPMATDFRGRERLQLKLQAVRFSGASEKTPRSGDGSPAASGADRANPGEGNG